MSYRTIGPPAFVAGVAAAYVWALAGRPGGLALAAWVAIGLSASLGAARVATQLASNPTPRPPSIVGCGIACALGGAAVILLSDRWLRLLGGAGFILMLYLALGLLAGLVDVAWRIHSKIADR